ncbi:CBS domain-containing protein [Halobacterium jilantaiense]|uniref:CBS domain-containing protein n=1 Tax=Halobacterium jilantaiense TaxID=355548 RepID=A0A1I0MI29_9EURY|nr:CBS domain-containing protein [Halobacterium jilantaiense]SEV87440.1 CBS domain-containing protein [Halobacterium jilantaiense]
MDQLALRDVMSRDFVGVSEADGLLDAVSLLREENTTSAVVLRGTEPVGMLTADTVIDVVADDRDLSSVDVAEVMTETPASLPQSATVTEAGDVMARTGDHRVLVTADDSVEGVLEARDIAPAVAGRTESGGSTPATGGAPGSVAATTDTPVEMAESTSEEFADGPTDEYADGAAPNDYAEQGVCESCGGLAAELASVNGRLLCTECRSV